MNNIIVLTQYRTPSRVATDEDVYREMVIDSLIALQGGNVPEATDALHELLDELDDAIRQQITAK